MRLQLVATAAFGLEAVVRREIEALGCKIIKTGDGRVTYMGDERAIVRSNLWLRSADRVYICMGEFEAREFEELFQQTKALEWESVIPLEGAFPVVGGSVKSALHSVPACQKIIKKAVSTRLGEFYCREKLPETGAEYRIRFIAHKDRFVLLLDASGVGLHKRGYRVQDAAAPMKETLAAALVQLSFYHKDRILVDTCCGSGTIPIEAALIARNIAPGLNRSFVSQNWDFIPDEIWKEERKAAYEAADFDAKLSITGIEIDKRVCRAAKANADEAGVSEDINFICMDMTKWEMAPDMPMDKTDREVAPDMPKDITDQEIASGISNDECGAGASGPPLSINSSECNISDISHVTAAASHSGIKCNNNTVENIEGKEQTRENIKESTKESIKDDYVIVISNLPYAIRVGTTDSNKKIYKHIKKLMDECPKWSFFLITADKKLEKELGRKADRRRKLYNGQIETQFYQFHGLKK